MGSNATGSISRTDLYGIHHVVQNTHLSYCKEMVVSILRDEFSQDSYYHYVSDQWGYPLTPDLTDQPLTAGYEDDVTTRLFIGEKWRHDQIFYPALLVSGGTFSSKPIAMNRNRGTVRNEAVKVVDGYGNESIFTRPTHFVMAGAWKGGINIEVQARDILARDQLVAISKIIFEDIRHDQFLQAGILINSVNGGSPTEADDRQQEKLYKQTISLDIYTEWRREIPVDNVVDAINICVDFVDLRQDPPVVSSPNLTINTSVQLIDELETL